MFTVERSGLKTLHVKADGFSLEGAWVRFTNGEGDEQTTVAVYSAAQVVSIVQEEEKQEA